MKFSKALRHIDMGDVKKKHLQKESAKIKEQKKEEEFKQYLVSTMKTKKYSWREAMTTTDTFGTSLSAAPGDGDVTTPDAIDADSYANANNMFGAGATNNAFDGTQIRASGSGSGSGGFDVGGDYLAFQGNGSGGSGSSRMALLSPIDSSEIDTLTIKAIRGTGSNGGEHPDVVGREELYLIYKTPDMSRSSYISQDRNQNDVGAFPDDAAIIAINQGDGTLQDYSIKIPEYARAKGTIFGLFQLGNSGSQYDHYGVTEIKFQRKAPISVFVPLDDPEASSFIRSAEQGSTTKKRKKDVNDKLEASDEYTQSKFGNDFPGQEVRVGGDDPFASAKIGDDVEPSPQGKDEVTKSFADFQQGQKTVEVLKTPEQIQAQNDEYFADLDNLLTANEFNYGDPQVLELTDKILKLDPKNIDAYYFKDYYYYINDDIESAKGVVDEMIKNNPDSPDGYSLRSYYKTEEGDLAGAIEDLEKAVELEPDPEYVAYIEMELADLKFQEAEVETDNAERERIESEAAAMQEKAHQDYWNNADLIEQEQEEVQELAEYQYESDEQLLDDLEGFYNFYGNKRNPGRSDEVPNMIKAAVNFGAQYTYEVPNEYQDEYQEIINAAQSWEGTPTEWAKFYTDAYMRIVYDGDYDSRTYNWIYNDVIDGYDPALGNNQFPSVFGTPAGYLGEYKLSNIDNMSTEEVVRSFYDAMRSLRHFMRYDTAYPRGRSADFYNIAPYLNALAKRLPDMGDKTVKPGEDYFDYFLGTDPEPKEPINTLYDQMKALYDEEDPEKEIKTELKSQGYEKQYKDLMTAWDSADKFSKFITPLKNLSDALLGSKTAQNAKYENYKIAIAKSIMLNKPIRVNPDTIDPLLIQKLGDRITPNQILDYDEEQRYKAVQEKYIKSSKAAGNYNPSLVYDYEVERMMSGEPVIPIVSEPVPYADENIYEDEFGRVFINDGSVANNTFQVDKGYYGFASAYANDIMDTNPIAGRGQAQYQIVVPPDGTEPYLLYKDHAYHNVKSDDKGEVPGFMNQGAAGFVNWLGNTAHNRSDGDANTGGMAGYPPNIRGDVITEFRIKLTDLPEDVQGAVYRHPLMTEQPELTQFLKDTFYAEKWIKNIGGSKGLHDAYMTAIKAGDKLKDWVVDNGIELLAGKYKSASNLLQKYDDFIQQTVHTPDGKTYVPGYIDADGNVLQRVDATDAFKKDDQNHLKNMFNNDEGIQKILKGYLDGKNKKTELAFQLSTRLSNLMSKQHPDYRDVFANSLGKGTSIDVDQFLKGKIVLKKGFEFREKTVDANWFVKSVAAIIDVNPDAVAASDNPLISLATMTAARQLLHPVRGPATDWRKHLGHKQTFAQAMETAPQMPYKLEFDVSEKIMNILQGIEDEDKPKDDSDLGSAGEIGGVDATAAATAAAERRKKKKGKVNESNLYERLKKRPFFNPNDIKPEFPENPPPKLDPKTGMHPQYGKKAKRYGKLDPISANSMPPTGDPETDAVVNKQKTINKIKKMARNK